MKMCINKNVVAGAVVVGLALLVVAPRFLAGATPLLVMAICPLSMVVMMRGMSGRRDAAERNVPSPQSADQDRDRELREMSEEVNRLKAELVLRREDDRA